MVTVALCSVNCTAPASVAFGFVNGGFGSPWLTGCPWVLEGEKPAFVRWSATPKRRYCDTGSSVFTVASTVVLLLFSWPARVPKRSTDPFRQTPWQVPFPLPVPLPPPSAGISARDRPGVATGITIASSTPTRARRRPTVASGDGSHMSTPRPSPVKRRPNRRTRSMLSVTSSHMKPAAPIANAITDTECGSISTGTA